MSVLMLDCEACGDFGDEARPAVAFVLWDYSEQALCKRCLIALATNPLDWSHSRPYAPVESEAN